MYIIRMKYETNEIDVIYEAHQLTNDPRGAIYKITYYYQGEIGPKSYLIGVPI
jgi:hypothetical protein